ncbi:MAG: HPr family phosphocarrier protein [Deltaproteobacteria bacterium]|jgi:phosphotransferase system HPr (HPr) family protein|nr:HPr family phosphocarrier protein [Deltaproteobacteria bacterium]
MPEAFGNGIASLAETATSETNESNTSTQSADTLGATDGRKPENEKAARSSASLEAPMSGATSNMPTWHGSANTPWAGRSSFSWAEAVGAIDAYKDDGLFPGFAMEMVASDDGGEPYMSEVAVIRNRLGLHSRAAVRLSLAVEPFDCEIYVEKGDFRADARSVLDLISLCCPCNTKVTLYARGRDAERALEAASEMIMGRFGERE